MHHRDAKTCSFFFFGFRNAVQFDIGIHANLFSSTYCSQLVLASSSWSSSSAAAWRSHRYFFVTTLHLLYPRRLQLWRKMIGYRVHVKSRLMGNVFCLRLARWTSNVWKLKSNREQRTFIKAIQHFHFTGSLNLNFVKVFFSQSENVFASWCPFPRGYHLSSTTRPPLPRPVANWKSIRYQSI